MIRVLFINHSSVIGGAETNLLSILQHAAEGEFQPVGALLPNDGPLKTAVRELGIDVGLIDYHSLRWHNPFRYAQTMTQLITWMRRTRPAVIHLNHQWLISHVAQAAIVTKTPVVCHTRNYLDESFVYEQRRWLSKAQAIIVESRAVEQRSHELGLPEEHIRLIYNGADFDRFQKAKTVTNVDAISKNSLERPIVGFSGRIVPEKGPEDLIMAIPLVLESVPKARFCFLGKDQEGGAFVNQLKFTAASLGVEQSIEFLGFRTDVENVLKDFDVLAIPSRSSMPEGLPLTALEGLAAGCLMVATPNSGIPEAIIDDETGYLVEPADPRALARTIIRALTLPLQERARIQHNGRELVKVKFSIQRQVISLGKIYEELVR